MHAKPVPDKKHGKAGKATEQQGALRDDFRNRPGEQDAQCEQSGGGYQKEDNQRMGEKSVTKRPALGGKPKAQAAERNQCKPEARWRHILTPFSLRYFTAPGCHGIGEFFCTWFSSAMLLASPCTAISSSRFSMKVLTMS